MEPVPGADLAPDERHTDMSVDAHWTTLLKLDPRCADRLDVKFAPPLSLEHDAGL